MNYSKYRIQSITRTTDTVAFRYLAMVIAFVFITQIVFGIYQIQLTSRYQTKDVENKAQTQANFLASVSPEDVFFANFLPLETLMRQTAEDEDIVYSVILNNEGRPLTRYLNRDDDLTKWAIKQSDTDTILDLTNKLESHQDIEEIRVPIVSEGVQLGEVRLGYSTVNVQKRVQNSTIRTLLTSLLVTILISIFTILVFTIGIARPLQDIMKITKSYSSGNLDVRMKIFRNTEIDHLKRSFNKMAEALQQSIQELEIQREEARKLSFVARHTDNIVVISDSQGNIEWVNNAFVQVTGYSRDEVYGKRPGALLQGPKTDIDTVNYMRQQLYAQKGFRAELINYNKLGEEYWVELEVQPVYNQSNVLVNYIAIELDITERKISETVLKSYANELERSNRELQDFAYIASHDLQEPLRKIQTFGSRLSDKYGASFDEKAQDYLDRMLNAASRMQHLIISLLSFSQVSTRSEPFRKIELITIVQGVISDLEIKIEEVQAKIEYADLPTISADAIQMTQLFQNLISNALKFAHPARSPHIVIRAQENAEAVEVTIQDNGIGFDPKYSERIFGIFQRLHNQKTYEGTGVGLAICRRIVERHAGDISVQSTPSNGTMFIITLPKTQPSYNLQNERL